MRPRPFHFRTTTVESVIFVNIVSPVSFIVSEYDCFNFWVFEICICLVFRYLSFGFVRSSQFPIFLSSDVLSVSYYLRICSSRLM